MNVKSSHSTLEHTYIHIPRDQHLQSTVILDSSCLPTDTKVSDIESPPLGVDLRQQLARDHNNNNINNNKNNNSNNNTTNNIIKRINKNNNNIINNSKNIII